MTKTLPDTEEDTDISTGTTPSDDTDESPDQDRRQGSPPRSMRLRALIASLVFVVTAASIVVLAWQYVESRHQLAAVEQQAEMRKEAERKSLDYATAAAEINFQDLKTWKSKLVNGTSKELTEKLNKAASSMEQILLPLRWSSTARPLVAKVRSDTDGTFVVDTFVTVLTKTAQANDGMQSTATYRITLDSKNNWQITDVGGIDATMGDHN